MIKSNLSIFLLWLAFFVFCYKDFSFSDESPLLCLFLGSIDLGVNPWEHHWTTVVCWVSPQTPRQSWGHCPVCSLLSSVCFLYFAQFSGWLWQKVLIHFCIRSTWHTSTPWKFVEWVSLCKHLQTQSITVSFDWDNLWGHRGHLVHPLHLTRSFPEGSR